MAAASELLDSQEKQKLSFFFFFHYIVYVENLARITAAHHREGIGDYSVPRVDYDRIKLHKSPINRSCSVFSSKSSHGLISIDVQACLKTSQRRAADSSQHRESELV